MNCMNTRTRVSIAIVLWAFWSGLTSAESSQDSGQVGDQVSIKSDAVVNSQFVEVLNYGFRYDLNQDDLPLAFRELGLRLYAVPKEGNCLLDGHYVCSHHYYLAVTSFQLGIDAAVYDLGEVGEISDIEWLMPNQPLTARLRIRVTSLPRDYFEPKYFGFLSDHLPRRERIYELEVGLNRLTVRDCCR